MATTTTRRRVNIYVTDKISDLIDKYTEELGMNQGAFMSMCISEYAKNDEMLRNMATINQTIADLQNLTALVKKEKENE